MTVFQRAEASTFFGREIGIMYMHAHLRYAEALARVGDADGLLARARPGQPVGMTDRVPSGPPAPVDRLLLVVRRAPSPTATTRAEGYAGVRGGRRCRSRAAGGSTRPAPACSSGWSSSTCSASGAAGDQSRSTRCCRPRLDGLRRHRPAARPRRSTVRVPRRPRGLRGHAAVTVGGTRARRVPARQPLPHRRASPCQPTTCAGCSTPDADAIDVEVA